MPLDNSDLEFPESSDDDNLLVNDNLYAHEGGTGSHPLKTHYYHHKSSTPLQATHGQCVSQVQSNKILVCLVLVASLITSNWNFCRLR